MKPFIVSINKFLAESCGYLLLLLMLMIAVDMILRNIEMPIFGIVEVGIYITVAVVYLGLGFCEQKDGHVRISIIFSHLRPSRSAILRCVVGIVSFAITGIALFACFRSAISSFSSDEVVMAVNIPLYTWPARAAIVLGLLGYCGQILISIGNDIEKCRKVSNSSKTSAGEGK